MLLLITFVSATEISAAIKLVPKIYVFGFSASFKNSSIYLTDIQELDSAWIDTKTKFLCGRDSYSAQLKDHLAATINDQHRTCVVMFSTKKSDAEKKYMKLKRLYTEKAKAKEGYEMNYLHDSDFKFTAVDMSPYIEELNAGKLKKEKKEKKPKKEKKEKKPKKEKER